MDTTDSPNANLPARLPAASSRLPAQVTVAPRELAPAAPPSPINSRLLFRGLAATGGVFYWYGWFLRLH